MENKVKWVSWDWLSRKDKIKCIYEVVKPSIFWIENNKIYTLANCVMIWDVLDYVVEPDDTQNLTEYKHIDICRSWDFKRQPIENQTFECIDYVYSLLETNQPITS